MEQQNTPVPAGEDKTVAIVAYLTLIGFIVAIILHGQNKTRLGAYHLRQALGIWLTGLVGTVAIALTYIILIGFLLMPLWGIFLFVVWLMGLIAAINGETKPTIVFGPLYQKWFGNTFD